MANVCTFVLVFCLSLVVQHQSASYLLVKVHNRPSEEFRTAGVLNSGKPDCGCSWSYGCYIDADDPPPYGYKCKCKPNVHPIFGCIGSAVECPDKSAPGCQGCSEKECCTGWCLGHDRIA